MFGRSKCPACGSGIEWVAVDGLAGEMLAGAERAQAFTGEPVASAWRCRKAKCGEFGFFGAVHVGF